jgi:hypothetical protein
MSASKVREDRIAALRALGGFDDLARLRRALESTLGDQVHPDEMGSVLRTVFARRRVRPFGEEWVRTRWDDLTKKLPGRLGIALIRAAAVGCSDREAADRAAFYKPRAAKIDGAERPLAGALEEISLCSALHDRGAAALQKALARQKR